MKDPKKVESNTIWYTQKGGLFVVYRGTNFVHCYIEESAAERACEKLQNTK